MDLSKLSNEELAALKAGDYSKLSNEALQSLKGSSATSKKHWYDVSTEGLTKGALEALPTAGGLAGGAMGAVGSAIPTMGMGAVPGMVAGSSLGYAAGKGLENLGKKYLLDENITPQQNLKDVLMAVPEGATQEMGGQAISAALTKAAPAIYNSAFKKIDARAIEKGQDPVAPYMYEQGAWGGNKSLQEQMQARMDELANKRAGLYQGMEDAGVTIDPNQASQKAYDFVGNLQKENPYAAPKTQQMVDYLALAEKPMTPSQASFVKSSLYDQLPESAFDQFGHLNSEGKQLLQKLSQGYKTELEKAADFHNPGSGADLSRLNEEWGAYLGAQNPTRAEITKEGKKDLVTQVKGALTLLDPKAAAGMYGAQALNSPAVRTGGGLLLKKADNPTAQALWRTILGLKQAK